MTTWLKLTLHISMGATAIFLSNKYTYWRGSFGRFLSCGIILGSPLSCTDLFLYTITLPAVSCDAPPTLSYTTLELASRVLLSSKKPASSLKLCVASYRCWVWGHEFYWLHRQQALCSHMIWAPTPLERQRTSNFQQELSCTGLQGRYWLQFNILHGWKG